MSRIVFLLLCASCLFATGVESDSVKVDPPFPESSSVGPTSSTTATTTTTPAPTNATTTTPSPTKPTNATTTTPKPTIPTNATTTTSKPTTTTTKPTTTTTNPTTTTPPPTPTPAPPAINNFTGNYSDSDKICLMMKMAVQLELLDKNSTKINVTENVTYNVTCGNNTVQNTTEETLSIYWDKNNLTFIFLKNDSKYEIQSIIANISQPGGNVTTLYHNKSEFSVSTKQSYRCAKDQPLNLTDSESKPVAKLHISHLQYQVFMNTTKPEYDSAWYCDATNTPDVVPVVVGCVLAILVVLVLVAYLYGRRRCQARGYLSM